MANLSLFLLAAPIAVIGAAAPAAAEGDKESSSVILQYRDLDLTSAKDRDRLSARIKSAVRSVCGNPPGYRIDLRGRMLAARCEEAAGADADAKMAALFDRSGVQLADRGEIVVAIP